MTHNSENVLAAADRMERRSDRQAAEAQRMALARLEQARATRGRVHDEIFHDGGHTRLVRRVTTTAGKLVQAGKIDRGLKASLEEFARLVAVALGAATIDGDDSTSSCVSQYDPTSGGGSFGPRSMGDRRLQALEVLARVRRYIPNELVRTFTEIVAEEVGSLMNPARSLARVGESRGYMHKQASAAGGVEVAIMIELIAHLMQLPEVRAVTETTMRVTMSQKSRKNVAQLRISEELAA